MCVSRIDGQVRQEHAAFDRIERPDGRLVDLAQADAVPRDENEDTGASQAAKSHERGERVLVAEHLERDHPGDECADEHEPEGDAEERLAA